MGRQQSIGLYLASKRERALCNGFKSKKSKQSMDWRDYVDVEMDKKIAFIKGLSASSIITKRGFVYLPMIAPAVGMVRYGEITGNDVPDTYTFQTSVFKDWVAGYWTRHGFRVNWVDKYDCDPVDYVRMDWPTPSVHIVQGPRTFVSVLCIRWM